VKISVIGGGNVGGTAAMRIAQAGLGDVYLVDIAPGLAKGKAFDLEDSRALVGVDYAVTGTDRLSDIAGSDVIVITAGLARKPGMTREDLLAKNCAVLKGICEEIKASSPSAVVMIVTNPLDVMTYYALKTSGFAPGKLFGMGVTLDAARFANLISEKTGVPVSKIKAMVVGSHGEGMLPLDRFTTVDGKSLTETLDSASCRELCARTVDRGKEIVSLLGSGSAYYAPSAAIAQLVDAIVHDRKHAFGVSAYLSGQYGVSGICAGVPCVIGRNGIESLVELDLNEREKNAFIASCESIRKLTGGLPL